jgi:hypothetical protein
MMSLALLLALGSGVPEPRPLVTVRCDRCGLCLAGIDADRGLTRCRECAQKGGHVAVVVAQRDPIEVACPICQASSGQSCDPRPMERRYHGARVNAARGSR